MGGTLVDGEPVATADTVELTGFKTGEVLAGRYRIVRFIAEGGMGQVYEARDELLGEAVALKTIRPDVLERPATAERFRRELQLARKVTHPNVCRMFDVTRHRDIDFLTMELLAGETLADRIRRDGALTPADALPIIRDLASALDAAHAAGVVHRDFKSHNVVLSGKRAVVTDFGLARPVAQGTGTTTAESGLVGTPAYMAPEQVEGRTAGPGADVYAFGVVMYELVTGALPFGGDSLMQIATRRLTEAPPSPRDLRPDLPRAWERTILRCLARRPEDRPSPVSSVIDELRNEAAPRRRRAPIAAVGALAVVGAFAAWWNTRPEPRSTDAAAPREPGARPKLVEPDAAVATTSKPADAGVTAAPVDAAVLLVDAAVLPVDAAVLPTPARHPSTRDRGPLPDAPRETFKVPK